MPGHDEHGSVRSIWYVVAVLTMLYAVVNGLAFGAIYWGDEYASPSWNAHSVPPPITR